MSPDVLRSSLCHFASTIAVVVTPLVRVLLFRPSVIAGTLLFLFCLATRGFAELPAQFLEYVAQAQQLAITHNSQPGEITFNRCSNPGPGTGEIETLDAGATPCVTEEVVAVPLESAIRQSAGLLKYVYFMLIVISIGYEILCGAILFKHSRAQTVSAPLYMHAKGSSDSESSSEK